MRATHIPFFIGRNGKIRPEANDLACVTRAQAIRGIKWQHVNASI